MHHPRIHSLTYLLNFIVLLMLLVSCSGGSDSGSIPNKDSTRPTVTNTIPANGDIDVPDTTSIQITFNKDMNKQSVESGFVIDNGVTGSILYDATNRTATFNASASTLVGDKTYTVILRNTLKDSAGNFIVGNQTNGDYFWTFTTLDNVSPTIINRIPANDPTGSISIDVSTDIVINFSEEIDLNSLNSNITILSGLTNKDISGKFSTSGSKVIFKPSMPLTFNTVYTVTVNTSVKDLNNNSISAQDVYSFKTGLDIRPRVRSIFPVDKALNVPRKPTISVEFTKPMNATLFNSSTFSITDSQGATVPGTYNYVSSNNTATFIPKNDLVLLETYKLKLSSLLTDDLGNQVILTNDGISIFSIIEGIWNATSSLLATTIKSDYGYQVTTDGLGNALLIWKELDISTTKFYSKHFIKGIGWDAQSKIAKNGVLDHWLYESKIEMDKNGNALMIYRDVDISNNNANQTNHIFAIYYTNNKWSAPLQLDRSTDTSMSTRIEMAPNGKAIAFWSFSSNTEKGMMSKRYLPRSNVSKPFGWQPLEILERTGTFNGVSTTGLIQFLGAVISNSGVPTIIYGQSDGIRKNLWANKYPFMTTDPILIESNDTDLGSTSFGPSVNYKSNINNNSIVSFYFSDGTYWTNNYSDKTGWDTEKQISTVPLNLERIETFKLQNNNVLVIYIENGVIKSTEFSPITGWKTPTIVAQNSPNLIYSIGNNKNMDAITVTWKSSTALLVRTFTPTLGWQPESIIIKYTDQTLYSLAKIIIHNDKTMSAVWYQNNSITGKRDIYTKILN